MRTSLNCTYWFLLIFVFISIIIISKKTWSVLKKAAKKKSKNDEKQTNETPISLLEVKVSLPTRVIFGDEAIVEKYDPSSIVQIPKLRLGEGTLGTLYKAVLQCGTTVTIRKIRDEVASSDDFEFWVKFFGEEVRDDSLLTLLFGFWYGGEAFVVHEYFCLGSLEELLHGTEGIQYTSLTWKIRQQIALDAAKALAAIHSQVMENGKPLVCGLIKASNILIRVDFSACLSSYEIPYLIPPATIIRRNPGRIAPELAYHQNRPKVFSQKSDIYSFGVLLLELVTGKRASVTNLGEYIKEKKRREGFMGIPDKRMDDANEDNMVTVISLARWCLQNDPKERPSIGQVVQMIQALE